MVLPLLSLIFSAVGIYGGCAIGVHWLGLDPGAFWGNMRHAVDFHNDILTSMVKSVVFAGVVTWIAVFEGFAAEPTAAGVAQATTRTVVFSSLAVLGLDFVLTALMMGGWS